MRGKSGWYESAVKRLRPTEYPKTYDEAVLKVLIRLWEGINYQCSKLLALFLNRNIDAISGHPDYTMGHEVREKLRRISASTVERLLVKNKEKMKIRGTGGTKSGPPLKKRVAILTHRECALQPPRFFQIDRVQHDGGNPVGEFADLRSESSRKITVRFAKRRATSATAAIRRWRCYGHCTPLWTS
jgi:hypothetical protein